MRKSLITQLNQRAYFHDEYNKSQRLLAAASNDLHNLQQELLALKKRNHQLAELVEAHEATNASLQLQLAAAHRGERGEVEEGGDVEKDDQHIRMESPNHKDKNSSSSSFAALAKVSMQLQEERQAHRATKAALTDVCEEKALMTESYEDRLAKLEERLSEAEESAADRIKVLSEQLKLANCLKDEYKARLLQAKK